MSSFNMKFVGEIFNGNFNNTQDVHICPFCGSENVEIEEEENGDLLDVRHLSLWKCSDCKKEHERFHGNDGLEVYKISNCEKKEVYHIDDDEKILKPYVNYK